LGAHAEARIVRGIVAAVVLFLGAYCLIAAATALDAATEQNVADVAAPSSRAAQEPAIPLARSRDGTIRSR
jgi:hypothetical protein